MNDPATILLTPEHFETVLDAIPDAVFTVNRDFVVTTFNRAAERLSGLRRGVVVGQRCRDIFRNAWCQKAGTCPMTLALRTGCGLSTRELTLRNRRDEEIAVRLTFSALRDRDGQVVGGVESIHELSAPEFAASGSAGPRASASAGLPLLGLTERRAIEQILRRTNGNRTRAARELGVSRVTLWRKMRKLGIPAHPPS